MDDDDEFEADKEYRATKTWSVGELELLWDLKTKDRKFDIIPAQHSFNRSKTAVVILASK